MAEGYIALYRILLDKPIWTKSTPEHKTILITLLLMANHEENEWEWMGQKFKVFPGQFVTSLDGIKKACGKGISLQNIRSALARFQKLEFLTDGATKTGRLITILKWHTYQIELKGGNKDSNKEVTKNQQRGNKEVTPNNNDNNDNNDKKYIYTSESTEIYLSELLFNLMQQNNPSVKKPDFQKWAHNIDLMIRIDKRQPEDIEKIIRFSQQDSFWQQNILSTMKLRDQYDKLYLKCKPAKGKVNSMDILKEMYKEAINE